MNDKSWRDTVKHGVSKSKPVYAAQMAIYQAYMEASIPGISANQLVHCDQQGLRGDLVRVVPFDGGLAQRMSDRAVRGHHGDRQPGNCCAPCDHANACRVQFWPGRTAVGVRHDGRQHHLARLQ